MISLNILTKVALLSFAILFDKVESSCFGRDAHFKKTDQPVVTLVSKTDPTRVTVSWDKIISRPQCVDQYNVYVWQARQDFKMADKVVVKEKVGKDVATTVTVTIEPCVSYKFMVELNEWDSLTSLNQEQTGEQVFKSPAIAKVPSLDKASFQVSYHWDTNLKHVDLQKADIVIPGSLITYPQCLDAIEVRGSQVRVTTGPPLVSGLRSVSPARGQSLRYLTGGKGYNPSLSVNTASTLPAKISYSDVTRGSSGSSSPPSPSYPAPQFANTMPRQSGTKQMKAPVKISSPFPTLPNSSDIILTVPVEDCAQYNFDLKFVSSSREAGSVSGVPLPALADQPGYVPPPVTSVLTISFSTSGKPIYAVKTASGVTAACLPAYFEAYDSYTQRLENEVGWQASKSLRISNLISSSENDLLKSQEELLKSLGCQCTSPKLNITTSDPQILKKEEAGHLGQYSFQGIYMDRPYYTLVGGSKQVYLYHDSGKQQWRVALDLGGKKDMFFASEEKLGAKCPGDIVTEGHWKAATGTFGRFKTNKNVKVVCVRK